MPPTSVHFNGGVNLADAESVMREIATRVPDGVRRIPDGETGPRQQWIFFQLEKFWQTPGLEQAAATDKLAPGYEQMPKVRLADGAEPDDVQWPNLGYADAYLESFETSDGFEQEGVIPSDVRFQVEYPTPLASINGWIVREDQDRLEPSYERALFADLDRLLASIPHDDMAVQWDVAVEFGILEGGFEATEAQTFDLVVERAGSLHRTCAGRRAGRAAPVLRRLQAPALQATRVTGASGARLQCRFIPHCPPGELDRFHRSPGPI